MGLFSRATAEEKAERAQAEESRDRLLKLAAATAGPAGWANPDAVGVYAPRAELRDLVSTAIGGPFARYDMDVDEASWLRGPLCEVFVLVDMHNRLFPGRFRVDFERSRSFVDTWPNNRYVLKLASFPRDEDTHVGSTPMLRSEYLELLHETEKVLVELTRGVPQVVDKCDERRALLVQAGVDASLDEGLRALEAEVVQRTDVAEAARVLVGKCLVALEGALEQSEKLALAAEASRALYHSSPHGAPAPTFDLAGLAESEVLNRQWSESVAGMVDGLRVRVPGRARSAAEPDGLDAGVVARFEQ